MGRPHGQRIQGSAPPVVAAPSGPSNLPRGVRDLLPAEALARKGLGDALLGVFSRAGFSYVATPMFEYADVLGKGLGAGVDLALRFVEPGSGDFLAVRPDFTPQLARLVAQRYRDHADDLRLCYEGAVYRVQAGHGPREIAQAGVERFGHGQAAADAEVLGLACAVMAPAALRTRGTLQHATIEIGHVAPTQWLLSQADAASNGPLVAALRTKNWPQAVNAAQGLPAQARRLMTALFELTDGSRGGATDMLAAALALPWPSQVRTSLDGLAATVALVLPKARGLKVLIDLCEIRGFDYYTGLRFAGYARGFGDAILAGGRYDGLVARYGRDVPAVGFAVDIEGVHQCLEQGA
ncbi:MAG: ATP phosphoribosyltransferase regulatory subunit [Myxococcales bacterium]|nr:ATP phosphoribosyltransferase regulatory subunit [Myxococcales bacterium]